MRRSASVYAYDYMDKVGVTVTVTSMPATNKQKPQRLYHKVVTVQGTGEDDDRQWLIDALVALLEDL